MKNGSIAADGLKQISMEEALIRTKPPIEVGVTLVGDRGVKLTIIDNSLNAGPEYSYAWYVYRNGERLKQYDRKYDFDPEYDLILAEDGVYQFRLFYRNGDVTNAVSSEKILVGEAQSQDAA